MVTEEEWNGRIQELKNNIYSWAYRMVLTDDELRFMEDMLLFKLMNDLEDSKWDKLQEYLKDVEEEKDDYI
jgi:hypothetical protein